MRCIRQLSSLLLAVLSVVLLPAGLLAQASLHGIVRDDSTASPIAGVEVLLSGTALRTTTNAAGRYEIPDIPPGAYEVVFRMVGYLPARVPVVLAAGESLRVNQVLSPSAVVLEPVVVTGEAMRSVGLAGPGFEERRRMGFGRFYTPEELREMEHLRLPDVLRRKGGVDLQPWLGDRNHIVAMNPRYRDVLGQLNCYMTIYLDGRMIWKGGNQFDQLEMRLTPPPNLLRDYGVNDFTAIEVYTSSAGIPVEFGGTSGQCGAVVLWTRRGPER